ncbi:MAG: HAD family hydrolase [Candidatus Hodarchaeales archaeon]
MISEHIRYILLDFDGTIIDSMSFLEKNAVSLLVKHFSFSHNEAQEKYRITTGLPFIKQMEIIAPKNQQNDRIVKEFERLKLDLIFEQEPFKDALLVIRKLKNQEYLIGISSGTIESTITEYLGKKDFTLVDDILGFREGFEKGKDHFEFIKAKYSIQNTQILFIGDSLHDAKRARDNNIQFIGRIGMFGETEFDSIIPKCPVINELSELINII